MLRSLSGVVGVAKVGRVNSTRRLGALLVPSGDGYGLARVVVAERVAVVVSIGALVAIGPEWMRRHTLVLGIVLAAALVYGAILMAYPRYEVRRTRYSWLVSALDAVLTLALIWLTGGAASPVAVVLVLVVIASAARLTFIECLMLSILVGIGYLLVILLPGSTRAAAIPGVILGSWWALYAVFVAVLSGGLSVLAEREHRSRVRALVDAEAEHAAAEEERDLRARLLRSYEAQREGLQVLLHEFRTPVASLDALAGALTGATPMTPSDHDAAIRLASRHARHLSDMLDALSDVNLSRRPTFSSGRVRRVDLSELIAEAGDAAGVRPPRLQITVCGETSAIQVDAQGLRRVLTNLLENAARHGRDRAIDVVCERSGRQLHVAVLDRGPGVSQENLSALTGKFVSLSDRRGTAGLGLWIVAQIIDALGGTLQFSTREQGGLTAEFTVPVR
jgi:signal transduction histidine kinase